MGDGRLHVNSPDDLPPELAALVREQFGDEDPAQPERRPVAAAVPKQARQNGTPANLITQDQARAQAEFAGTKAWRRARPLAGNLWATRTESTALRKVPGVLGHPAMWVYVVKGYCHFGWILGGGIYYWEAQVKADDGRVLGVQLKKVKPA